MNRDLKDLATIIDSLPENISYFSYFSDNGTGEFIHSCSTKGENPFSNISNLYKHHIEEGIIETKTETFICNLYAMFFSIAENEGYEVLNEFKNAINEIIENYEQRL